MSNVYFDNAATTRVDYSVMQVINDYFQYYENPSSLHTPGIKCRKLIDYKRKVISEFISANPDEIYFTSSGTESNNIAILGFARANKHNGNHIITSVTEHSSVLNAMKQLEKEGFEVTYIGVDSLGMIDENELLDSIRNDTILISIMYVNNEIGNIQPVKRIGEIAKQYGICFHTDAVQAIGELGINVDDLNVDMMSISGHKIYAPKGIGVLYVKNNICIEGIVYGGGQENGLRSGTENTPYICGLASAFELVELLKHTKTEQIPLKKLLIDGIMERIPNVRINSPYSPYFTDNILSISIANVDAESLLVLLDVYKIFVSSGSACSASSNEVSHVIKAIGVEPEYERGTIRISLGKYNTVDEVNYFLDILPMLVKKLREESNGVDNG